MNRSKIQPVTLVDQVVAALQQWIETEELQPGDRLPSTARLVREFGVSRPVIREALKTLEGRGVIEIGNGRRAVIKPVSSDILHSYFHRAVALGDDNLLQILEVRHGLEVQAARLAAQRATPEDLERLQHLVDKMRARLHDSTAYTELDLEFHLSVAAAAHNKMLYFLVESIRDVLRDTIQEGLRYRLTERDLELVQSTHEDIVQRLVAHDGEGSAQAMAFHFDDAIRAIFYPDEDVVG